MNCPPRVGDADAKGASVVTTETLVSQRNPQRGYGVCEVKRRGYYCNILYHLPLFEGTPPTPGGEFKGE